MTANERRRLSASKAHKYFQNYGRGFLHTKFDDEELQHWVAIIPQAATHLRLWRNTYIPLTHVREAAARYPDDPEIAKMLMWVECYEPEREAVVDIQYESGGRFRAEVVLLEGEEL
jgi:hypothetical protein